MALYPPLQTSLESLQFLALHSKHLAMKEGREGKKKRKERSEQRDGQERKEQAANGGASCSRGDKPPRSKKRQRREQGQQQQPEQQQQQQLQLQPRVRLMDLHDGILQNVVRFLGIDRRTVMLVSRRMRDLAQRTVHSHQRPGQSVQDAIEAAEAGDTVHLLPGFYKEALLIKRPLHLTCDDGQARVLSPARFAVMCNARGCLLENMVLKSHQIDESTFFLVEFGPRCSHICLRRCEVLQGSFVGIQDLKGPNTSLLLQHCKLHVGLSLMAGRLEMTDCSVQCTGDSLWAYPGTTLVARRCNFVDFVDPVYVESETAVIEHCSFWAYDQGPLVVCNTNLPPEQMEEATNERILHLEEEPPTDVWISLPRGIKAAGRRASPQQRAAVERGELVPGHVVLWGNTMFESRSQAGITAQQEEVRREARALMLEMQREIGALDGEDPEDVSVGNSQEDPEPLPGHDGEFDDGWSDDSWSDGDDPWGGAGWGDEGPEDGEWSDEEDYSWSDASGGPPADSDSMGSGSSSSGDEGGEGGAGGVAGGSSRDGGGRKGGENSSKGGGSKGGGGRS